MREAKRKRIREAYFGPLTLREVARANAVGEAWLERFWRDEKRAGRIADVPRPHFAKFCKPPAPAIVEVIDDDIADVSDEAPLADPNPRFERECAALLAALREHHADLDRTEAHIAPELLRKKAGIHLNSHKG